MRLTRVLVPSVRASPAAGKAAETLGFSPALRVRVARRMAPMQEPPEHTSRPVAALPSSHGAALLGFSQPTAGGVQKSVVQTLPSSQLRAPPRQVPAVQVSPTVQALPSVHVIPSFRLTKPQTPAPLQALLVQMLAAVQGAPAASKVQSGAQQSPATRLPSSHCSLTSRRPLPHTSWIRPMTEKRFVTTPWTGSPGPATRKKFVPQGLPVTVWSTAGSPTNPAGAAGAVASHTR